MKREWKMGQQIHLTYQFSAYFSDGNDDTHSFGQTALESHNDVSENEADAAQIVCKTFATANDHIASCPDRILRIHAELEKDWAEIQNQIERESKNESKKEPEDDSENESEDDSENNDFEKESENKSEKESDSKRAMIEEANQNAQKAAAISLVQTIEQQALKAARKRRRSIVVKKEQTVADAPDTSSRSSKNAKVFFFGLFFVFIHFVRFKFN